MDGADMQIFTAIVCSQLCGVHFVVDKMLGSLQMSGPQCVVTRVPVEWVSL